MLVEQFVKHGKLENLADFASNSGRKFYKLPKASWQLEIVEEKREVPQLIGFFVPFRYGEMLKFNMR